MRARSAAPGGSQPASTRSCQRAVEATARCASARSAPGRTASPYALPASAATAAARDGWRAISSERSRPMPCDAIRRARTEAATHEGLMRGRASGRRHPRRARGGGWRRPRRFAPPRGPPRLRCERARPARCAARATVTSARSSSALRAPSSRIRAACSWPASDRSLGLRLGRLPDRVRLVRDHVDGGECGKQLGGERLPWVRGHAEPCCRWAGRYPEPAKPPEEIGERSHCRQQCRLSALPATAAVVGLDPAGRALPASRRLGTGHRRRVAMTPRRSVTSRSPPQLVGAPDDDREEGTTCRCSSARPCLSASATHRA